MSQGRTKKVALGRISKGSRVVFVGLLLPLITALSLLPTVRAANAQSFTFTAAGDYGGITTGSNGQKVAIGIANKTANLHIALGDLGYGDQSPSHWCSSFKAIYPGAGGTGSLVLVTGNHDTWNGGSVSYLDGSTGNASDTLTSDGPAPHGFLDTSSGYITSCGAPNGISWVGSGVSYGGGACNPSNLTSPSCYAREYYFDYPTSNPIMRFILISAGIGGSWVDYSNNTSGGTAHYQWLKARIDEAKNAGMWVAVVTHKNCISDDSDLPDCASTFDPFKLALTKRVDLWLDGHSHTYQRSYQLKSSSQTPCTRNNSTNVVSCPVSNNDPTTYTRGGGTVVNIIGTGGEVNDPICNPPSSCPSQNQFAKLCGSNGDVASPKTTGCNNDYGFSYFTVNTTMITAHYISVTGTFTDTYAINVNPPDFSISAAPPDYVTPPTQRFLPVGPLSLGNPLPISRGVLGSPSSVIINSFGGFNGNVTLSGTVSGGGVCPGSNCPTVGFSSTSLNLPSGGKVTSNFSINSTRISFCEYPGYPGPAFNVTIIAAHGSNIHQTVFKLYVFANADIVKMGQVNIFSLAVVGGAFGETASPGPWNPDADLNNDNKINLFDLTLVGGSFGGTCS